MADNLYYLAAFTDGGLLVCCEHQHGTVASAVACICAAGGYVVAVQEHSDDKGGRMLRTLNKAELAEFQEAMFGKTWPDRKPFNGLLGFSVPRF